MTEQEFIQAVRDLQETRDVVDRFIARYDVVGCYPAVNDVHNLILAAIAVEFAKGGKQ